jgi:hypothetical protein
MERADNPELTRLMLDHLANLYKLKQKREGIHLSTLIYCLTRSFFDQQDMIEPTDNEVMLFALGLGLQDVLTPTSANTPIYEKEGITFSPDMYFEVPNFGMVELKTTRMSSGKEVLPETWFEYIKGGCYMIGSNIYDLAILHMLGNYHPPFPILRSERLTFTKEELQSNWDYLLERKAVYCKALETNIPPEPYKYCKEWECQYCRYKLQCQAINTLKAKEE